MAHEKFHDLDLDRELDGFEFPPTFDFGVSASGYQTEGGFNTPDGPKNNWYWFEQQGKKERTGYCARFLELYEEDFDRAAWIGANAFRLGIEWARLQPGVDPAQSGPPAFSVEAARQYARVIAAAVDRGMFPAVTLWHFTNPLWAGLDFWLDWGQVREQFGAFVEFSVREINRVLIDELHHPPIPYFITLNEPINVPMAGYLLGVFPIGKKGRRPAAVCYANILQAHALAYRTIHRIYREKNWPRPTVNTWCAAAYSFDKMAQDLFLARANNVSREGLHGFLVEQRARLREHLRAVPYLRPPRFIQRAADRLIDKVMWDALTPDIMAPLADYIYESDDPRLLDVVGFDLYDPFMGNNLDFGFPRLINIRSQPYQWNANPRALRPMLEAYSWTAHDLPLHLLEHGMCHRAAGGRVYPHPNGLTRDEELKLAMLEVVRAIRAGLKLRSFYYWSLLDNYEWGSFEPRFGLFGLDYANGARRMTTDINGVNAAGAYRLFIEAFQNRDKAALREAFSRTNYPVISK